MRRLCVLVLLAACGGDDDDGGGAIDAGDAIDAGSGIDAASADAGPTADLVIRAEETADSIAFAEQEFDESSCALAEQCIGAPGIRALLQFDVAVANQGEDGFALPDREEDPWVYGACHDHFHLEGFSRYELIDEEDNVVAFTSYDAFCVADVEKITADGPDDPVYVCPDTQGISVGWQWVSTADVPCQWIDITGIAPGDYTLRVTTNADRVVPEADFDNNSIDVPVTIPPG